MTPPALTPEDDRELLRLLIQEAVSSGMDKHMEKVHKDLNDKLDATRRHVWMGAGIVLTISMLARKLFP